MDILQEQRMISEYIPDNDPTLKIGQNCKEIFKFHPPYLYSYINICVYTWWISKKERRIFPVMIDETRSDFVL